MRCGICNKPLSSYESTLKHAERGDYLDMCLGCIDDLLGDGVLLPTKDRKDLLYYSGIDEELDEGF